MQRKVVFGPSGNSDRFRQEGYKHTYQAPEWLAKMGLSAFEYSFGQGVRMLDDTAKKIGLSMREYNIEISAHAPYYINFANLNEESIQKSLMYVLSSVKAVQAMGGKRVVMHTGTMGKDTERATVLARCSENIARLIKYLDMHTDGDYIICPETMGKYSQIGSYREIMELCVQDRRLVPCLDFGHINCIMQGALKTVDDYKKIIDCGIQLLGQEKMDITHVHFSKIEYTKAGEKKHLTFDDAVFGPDYRPFVQAIVDCNLHPFVVCESDGTMADDALAMKTYYDSLVQKV